MNLTGIITEYNPFHLGHKYHLEKAIEDTNADGIVSVMSGNFMQRGNPAIIDKYNRAKMAVLNGVDLVLELPLVYSLSSAENFAYGGVKLLNSLNCIDNIYFGSESGKIEDLISIAQILKDEPKNYKDRLKIELDKGLPFHTARLNALNSLLLFSNISEILSSSNNILAIEYIKALLKLDSNIKPFTLKREGSNYNDISLSKTFSSATSIRETLKDNFDVNIIKNSIPTESLKVITELNEKNYNFVFEESLFPFLKYKLLTNAESIKSISDVSEGLDNKILKEIINCNSLKELILKSKSKRYTYTKISRILSKVFIGFENFPIEAIQTSDITYIRPLAFNEKGAKILKSIKENSEINILTKIPRHISNNMLQLDLQGTKAYSLLNNSISPMEDYFKTPYIYRRI
ncbi:nucleotidyltransferase [Clostridium sardiniense]|uniref:tRNA(Met) cytidine acetate ligase n=1 Tax=Clostridium sardiniense TaxID=29369 RepID=A0ABS7KXR8_CLOSR|nr:nucleotidyltransferase [Clostridium sardiniense]MBY0755539.1 nucleotidyltransferase [Clostridium sardiniense]MDQ0460927.1 putative nucleotidyltransferase [Clostridium sardiniense]